MTAATCAAQPTDKIVYMENFSQDDLSGIIREAGGLNISADSVGILFSDLNGNQYHAELLGNSVNFWSDGRSLTNGLTPKDRQELYQKLYRATIETAYTFDIVFRFDEGYTDTAPKLYIIGRYPATYATSKNDLIGFFQVVIFGHAGKAYKVAGLDQYFGPMKCAGCESGTYMRCDPNTEIGAIVCKSAAMSLGNETVSAFAGNFLKNYLPSNNTSRIWQGTDEKFCALALIDEPHIEETVAVLGLDRCLNEQDGNINQALDAVVDSVTKRYNPATPGNTLLMAGYLTRGGKNYIILSADGYWHNLDWPAIAIIDPTTMETVSYAGMDLNNKNVTYSCDDVAVAFV